jgi:fatty-acyl-CoA synthase
VSFPVHNVGLWTARVARRTPGRAAIEWGGRAVTYAELDGRAALAAGALAALGVVPGDRVAALSGNRPELAELLFACARLGAIFVPISPRLAVPEVAFQLGDADPRVLVHDPERATLAAAALRAAAPPSAAPGPAPLSLGEDGGYEEALAAASPLEPQDVSPEDPLAIFYTSGTTGRPKGVVLTHGAFFWANLNMLLALDLSADERSLVVLPMFHVGGWNVNTLAVWWKGGTVVLEPSFDAGRALALIDAGVTSMMGVPTVYQMMAEHEAFEATDFSRVRALVCGGAPLPVALIRRYAARRVRFVQGYGLTEAGPNCLLLPPEDAERKAGAAGRPYVFTDVRLVDPEGREVGPGGVGEVVVRGPSVMKEYWRLPEETARALRDGWLHTGDLGRLDEEGDIWIVDRLKDLYISGGENVSPAEVEAVLCAHPAVAEAAVIGVPDERWGEVGRAVVVLRPGAAASAEELRAFCAERLARFKIPASVVFADALPRNPTGKLLKAEIRQRFGDVGAGERR